MTTSLATIQPPAGAPAPVDWNGEIRGAQYLMKSGLVPSDIKTPEAALFIILTGRDLGMSPVQSLRSIRVIKGKVEVAADAQLGKFHSAGGKSRFVELTNTMAKLELRAGWLTQPHVETFSLQDAQTAGLAGGDNWRKYPKAMLRSRVITAGLKSIGFDACAGVYGHGEISGEEIVIEETGAVESARPDNVTADGEVLGDAAEPDGLTLPGAANKWGGHGGMALTELPDSVLGAFVAWVQKDPKRETEFAAHVDAISGIIADRQADAEGLAEVEA